MAAAAETSRGSMISLVLPQSPAARLAVQGALVVFGTLLLTLSAKTKVPLGFVDLSLQSLVVLLLAAALGWRLGVATLLLYLAEGAAGLPVFQSTPEKGLGIPYMLGPTGGYLAGFVVMAAIAGWAADRGWDRSVVRLFAAMLLADLLMLLMGTGWLAGIIGADKAWAAGFVPFLVPDLIKVALAACIVAASRTALSGLRTGR